MSVCCCVGCCGTMLTLLSGSTFSLDKTLSLPEELVSTIKAFLWDEAAWAKCVAKDTPPKPKLDAASAAWALKVLLAREADYPSSIEEDENLLQTELGERERMAVVVRLAEKRILKGARLKLEAKWDGSKVEEGGKRARSGEEEKEGKKVKVAK